MSGSSVLWAEIPEDDGGEDGPDSEGHGDLDESFAARRLRRWLRGMFGGGAEPAAEPEEPGREETP
jgi:hypothetical protein